jgi:hypothetical protein
MPAAVLFCAWDEMKTARHEAVLACLFNGGL